jgi:hypothetical protein
MKALAVFAALALLGGSVASAGKLPPRTLRGNENRLAQYPTVALATEGQRAAAIRILARVRAATLEWPTAKAAAAAGFDTHTIRRRAADHSVHYLHAENHRYSHDRHFLDPNRPEALIYANIPGWPLVLIGLMFAMPRDVKGPTPGGPITRWHTHTVCARGDKRGLSPRAGGSCPAETTARQGGEMLHVWLTGDLRSAFAIHAPRRELGLAQLLPAFVCHSTVSP